MADKDAEDERERLDRELIELLNELRVMVTGVQVLFAFLLAVAFSQRFALLSSLERYVYFGTLLSTAAASIWLIAPASYHRVLFRFHQKHHMIFVANRMAVTGSVFLALSIVGVLFIITDFLFGAITTAVVTVAALGLAGGLWFGLPLSRREGRKRFRSG